MTKTNELKPCPFCGGTPDVSTRMDEDLATHDQVEWVTVSCGGTEDDFCHADVSISIPNGYEGGTAIERWNARA